MDTTMTDLERRALSAYFRHNDEPLQPSDVDEVEHDGKRYVVLSNAHEQLAVYRVRTDGVLRLMKRPPKDLHV